MVDPQLERDKVIPVLHCWPLSGPCGTLCCLTVHVVVNSVAYGFQLLTTTSFISGLVQCNILLGSFALGEAGPSVVGHTFLLANSLVKQPFIVSFSVVLVCVEHTINACQEHRTLTLP